MRLKTFTAKTMPEAMALVKQAMGEEAVIMMTKQDKATGHVTVTAAVDEDFTAPPQAAKPLTAPPPAPDAAGLAANDDPLDILSEHLEWHSVPRRLAGRLLSRCDEAADPLSLEHTLTAALGSVLRTAPTPLQPGQTLALIGLPGAGKTVTTAKLATRARLSGTPLQVITTDTLKAGGIEQLETLLRVLGMATHSAHDAASLQTLLQLTRSHGAVLVDTPGINPAQLEERQMLHTLLGGEAIQAALVLPGGLDAAEAVEMAQHFAGHFALCGIIVPKLDIARRLGAVLAVADALKLPLLEAGTSAAISGGLTPFSEALVAQRLLSGPQHISKHL